MGPRRKRRSNKSPLVERYERKQTVVLSTRARESFESKRGTLRMDIESIAKEQSVGLVANESVVTEQNPVVFCGRR